MYINLPNEVEFIIEKLWASGCEAFIVGGCVRDILLDRIPNDWDICTDALPDKVTDIFMSFCTVIPTGIKHGTVTLLINKRHFEVTTYRIDGDYNDFRRPDFVSFTPSISEDLARRDFTINAMAYNNIDGLIDPFGGCKDLKNKKISCVGNAQNRLSEDYLRALRAVRFSCQLEFSITPSTVEAIILFKDLITKISWERIRDEFSKILLSPMPGRGIKLLMEYGLLDYMMPELSDSLNSSIQDRVLNVLEHTPQDLIARMAVLLYYIKNKGISIDPVVPLKRLKFDNLTITRATVIIDRVFDRPSLKTPDIKRFIVRTGQDNLDRLFSLMTANAIYLDQRTTDLDYISRLKNECIKIIESNEPLFTKDLSINGRDLISLGLKEGKEIGKVLNRLLDMVLENPDLNNKERLLQIVRENFL